jgi:hypothetical protein
MEDRDVLLQLKIAATRPLGIQQILHQPPHVNQLPLDDASRFCSAGIRRSEVMGKQALGTHVVCN